MLIRLVQRLSKLAIHDLLALGRGDDLSAWEAQKKRRREFDAQFTLMLTYVYAYRRRASVKVQQA